MGLGHPWAVGASPARLGTGQTTVSTIAERWGSMCLTKSGGGEEAKTAERRE